MAQVRKTSSSSAARGVVYDITQRRARTSASEAVSEGDSAGVSDNARALSHALQAVEAAPEARAERISALRQQIARGEYDPDPREVARKLLERGL